MMEACFFQLQMNVGNEKKWYGKMMKNIKNKGMKRQAGLIPQHQGIYIDLNKVQTEKMDGTLTHTLSQTHTHTKEEIQSD
jgi:hypothetical protein